MLFLGSILVILLVLGLWGVYLLFLGSLWGYFAFFGVSGGFWGLSVSPGAAAAPEFCSAPVWGRPGARPASGTRFGNGLGLGSAPENGNGIRIRNTLWEPDWDRDQEWDREQDQEQERALGSDFGIGIRRSLWALLLPVI